MKTRECLAKIRVLFYNYYVMKTVTGERFRLRLPRGARFALAFSGGRDSAVLFDLMKRAGADFFAVHVEHGIRGERSLADARFAQRFSEERGVECKLFRVSAPELARREKLTVEEAARKLRYEIFRGLVERGECDFVVLAHHADDQTETILMRILRGTRVRGLRGMSEVRSPYLRPLLSVSREEMDRYAREYGIPFVEDETNSDESYTRNFLRGELATLKERFPALNASFARLARNAAEADDLIEKLTPFPETEDGEAKVPASVFESPAVAKRAMARACAALGAVQDVEDRHYAAVIGLVGSGNGKRVSLSHGVTAHLDGGYVVFSNRVFKKQEDEIPFDGSVPFEGMGIRAESVPPEQTREEGALYIDADAIPEGAVLRKRREGDRITKFGGGSKSFGDFLTDRKFPLRKRDDITVCAVGGEILFAAGVEISDRVKITPNTKHAIKITEDKDVR